MSHIQLRSIHLSNLVQVRKYRMFLIKFISATSIYKITQTYMMFRLQHYKD